ncbi:hypothetical protein [Glaciecola sp. SC05]|uniref:hypothetical protein n=1 Tax=Glaciecola sp. SC05 TaxID=1987355 RepID=UPI0035291D35
MDKRIGLILQKLNIQYPNPSKLPPEAIEAKLKGDVNKACSLIIDEFGCSYDEAHDALSAWPIEGQSK